MLFTEWLGFCSITIKKKKKSNRYWRQEICICVSFLKILQNDKWTTKAFFSGEFLACACFANGFFIMLIILFCLILPEHHIPPNITWLAWKFLTQVPTSQQTPESGGNADPGYWTAEKIDEISKRVARVALFLRVATCGLANTQLAQWWWHWDVRKD